MRSWRRRGIRTLDGLEVVWVGCEVTPEQRLDIRVVGESRSSSPQAAGGRSVQMEAVEPAVGPNSWSGKRECFVED